MWQLFRQEITVQTKAHYRRTGSFTKEKMPPGSLERRFSGAEDWTQILAPIEKPGMMHTSVTPALTDQLFWVGELCVQWQTLPQKQTDNKQMRWGSVEDEPADVGLWPPGTWTYGHTRTPATCHWHRTIITEYQPTLSKAKEHGFPDGLFLPSFPRASREVQLNTPWLSSSQRIAQARGQKSTYLGINWLPLQELTH